jgi:hypothetical protein
MADLSDLSVRFFGAEDGIRIRDPHLGKVLIFVLVIRTTPLACCSLRPVSSPYAAVVERSTTSLC